MVKKASTAEIKGYSGSNLAEMTDCKGLDPRARTWILYDGTTGEEHEFKNFIDVRSALAHGWVKTEDEVRKKAPVGTKAPQKA